MVKLALTLMFRRWREKKKEMICEVLIIPKCVAVAQYAHADRMWLEDRVFETSDI